MARSQRTRVDVLFGMRMKQACVGATQHRLQARRIGEAEYTPVGVLARRAHNGNAFGKHHLIPTMGVQIARAHETCLRRMRVDPSEHHQILGVAVFEDGRLISRFAGI